MIYPMYSIRDKLNGFGVPFMMVNEALAIRAFKNSVENNEGDMAKNAADIELWHVGTFDTDEGKLVPSNSKKLASATDYVEGK